MQMIQAISAEQRQQVIALSHDYIERARQLFDRKFDRIPICFDLRGRAAGMYKVSGQQRKIRYNPYIFAKYFDENLSVTVPHEVAHYITDKMYGIGWRSVLLSHRIKPHGEEWQKVMHEFGADASRTCSFDMESLPVRAYKYYLYVCECRQHQLGSRRHNKVVRQQVRYHCQDCGGSLRQTA
jgi:SprT protein